MSSIATRPKLINAIPLQDKKIKLFYENGEIRLFSVKKYIETSKLFAHLKDENKFQHLSVTTPYVAFDEKTDFSTEVLYDESVPIDA